MINIKPTIDINKELPNINNLQFKFLYSLSFFFISLKIGELAIGVLSIGVLSIAVLSIGVLRIGVLVIRGGFKKFKNQKINYFNIIFEEIMKNIVDKQFPLQKKLKETSSKKEEYKLIKL